MEDPVCVGDTPPKSEHNEHLVHILVVTLYLRVPNGTELDSIGLLLSRDEGTVQHMQRNHKGGQTYFFDFLALSSLSVAMWRRDLL